MESKKMPDAANSNELATNLRILLDSHQLTITQLAQALDVPMMTIRRLLLGETTDPRISTLKMIARYFNISIDLLLEGDARQATVSPKSRAYSVPILEWDQVEKFMMHPTTHLNNWKEWQPISLPEENQMSKKAFALKSRPFMHPRFPQGTLFVIDPNISATDGDTVLVKINEMNELTLRDLVIDPPEWQLQPIVPGAKALQYNDKDYKIMGVNILTLLSRTIK